MDKAIDTVSTEELEALKDKYQTYANLLKENKNLEQELESLKQKDNSLGEREKTAGETHGK